MSNEEQKVNCFTVNQTADCLGVGLETGFQLFDLSNKEEIFLREFNFNEAFAHIRYMELAYMTSFKFIICHCKEGAEGATVSHFLSDNAHEVLPFTDLLSIKVNRAFQKRSLALCSKTKIRVSSYLNPKEISADVETGDNPRGLVSLSTTGKDSLMAYPAFEMEDHLGRVGIFDLKEGTILHEVDAHKNPLSAICLSPSGTFVATASTQGTLIKVFSTADMEEVCTFRRGFSAAAVHQLCFDRDARYLAAASDHPTVHIFDVSSGPSNTGLFSYPSATYDIALPPTEEGPKTCGFQTTEAGLLLLFIVTVPATVRFYLIPTPAPGIVSKALPQLLLEKDLVRDQVDSE